MQPQRQRPPVSSQSGPILDSGSTHGLVQRLSNSQLSFNTSIASIFSQVNTFVPSDQQMLRWSLSRGVTKCVCFLQVPRLSGAGGISSQLQAAQHQQRSSQVSPSSTPHSPSPHKKNHHLTVSLDFFPTSRPRSLHLRPHSAFCLGNAASPAAWSSPGCPLPKAATPPTRSPRPASTSPPGLRIGPAAEPRRLGRHHGSLSQTLTANVNAFYWEFISQTYINLKIVACCFSPLLRWYP